MASVTIKATGVCPGGEHVIFGVTGAGTAIVELGISDAAVEITNEDIKTFIRVCLKLGKMGRTMTQLKSLFTSGVTVTI